MNGTSEKLLTAMQIMAQKQVNGLSYDLTIQATIDSLVNLDTGEYKVKYNGNTFSAFSNDLTYEYKVGTNVYVKVPEGDFSNKKFIENKVQDKTLSESEMQQLENSYATIVPDLSTCYSQNWYGPYGIIAGATGEQGNCIIFNSDSYITSPSFLELANNYEYIQIFGEFLSLLNDDHLIGNYGLELEFYAKDTNGNANTLVTYRLDLNAFNGNPYHLTNYTTQKCIFKVQKNFLLGLKSVKLFNENFNYDGYLENGEVVYIYKTAEGKEYKSYKDENTNQLYYIDENNNKIIITDVTTNNPYKKLNTTNNNIFVRNVLINFMEKKDLLDNMYYLHIKTPNGTLFTEDTNSLDLVAQLIYNNNSILTEKNCKCYWYEQDYSINVGSELYDKEVGCRWRLITDKKLFTSFNTLHLTKENNFCQKTYKLLVIYNDNVKITEEITISNYDCAYRNATIKQEMIGSDLTLSVSYPELKGFWYYKYPDDSYAQVMKDGHPYYNNSLVIQDYLIYSSVVFYCAVYTAEENGTNIINLQHTVVSSENEEDVVISYSGEDSFRYDANGDITIEDSEKERLLECHLAWKEGIASAYKMEWLMSDGGVIAAGDDASKNRTHPSNSMIDSLWVDNSNILHYNIKQKYRINYNNNTIIIKITTIDAKVYEFKKEIIFVKDGDQGTNGTTYILTIRPSKENVTINSDGKITSNPDKLSGFQPLLYKNNNWQDTLRLYAYIYKDGVPIYNDGVNYEITYSWSGINIEFRENKDVNSSKYVDEPKTPDEKPFSELNIPQVFITGERYSQEVNGVKVWYPKFHPSEKGLCAKAQVNIKDKINNKQVELYAFYPLDVIVTENKDEKNKFDLSNIPSYIKYTTSGINPSFYSNSLNFTYDNKVYSTLNDIVSLNQEVLKVVKDSTTEEVRLSPASRFYAENDNYLGLLECTTDNNIKVYHTVLMYLNTFGNEAINGWDGTKLDIDGKGQYIFAPQIGAGKKDSYNRFTGVVMGQDSLQVKTGLYGYWNGINTFGLMENGTAYFGASENGRITIDGEKALIYGGTSAVSGNNKMVLTLSNVGLDEDTNAIQIIGSANNVFTVDYGGNMSANSGDIGGWIIKSDYIGTSKSAPNRNNFDSDYEYEQALKNPNLNQTYLFSNGTIICKKIIANTDGYIGGWSIIANPNKIQSADGNTILNASDGRISTDYFTINNYGSIGQLLGAKIENGKPVKTTNLGITSESGHSIVLESAENIRLTAKNTKVILDASDIEITGNTLTVATSNGTYIDPSNQKGIYARFA